MCGWRASRPGPIGAIVCGQVIMIGGLSNIEKSKHFRVMQTVRLPSAGLRVCARASLTPAPRRWVYRSCTPQIILKLIPHADQRKQRLDFKDDYDDVGGADERMDTHAGPTSKEEVVDVVELLQALRDVLLRQDKPLSVLGVPLSQQLLAQMATVLGSLVVSVLSSVVPGSA